MYPLLSLALLLLDSSTCLIIPAFRVSWFRLAELLVLLIETESVLSLSVSSESVEEPMLALEGLEPRPPTIESTTLSTTVCNSLTLLRLENLDNISRYVLCQSRRDVEIDPV